MKVIVTGATGLVGSALVRKCIADERITQVLALTRKPLPDSVPKSDKLVVVQHDDFSTYPPELLEKLSGAAGCLWALGGRATQFPDVQTARKVSVEYTLTAANAFVSALAPQLPEGKKFRFVFCSGGMAEHDQTKKLLFMQDTRRIKGEVEKGLLDIADDNKSNFEVWCVRPSGILPHDAGALQKLTGKLYFAIDADQLSKAMIGVLLDGYKDRIIENGVLMGM